jgi:hypothetical protein
MPSPARHFGGWESNLTASTTASDCCTFVLHEDQTPVLLSGEPESSQLRDVDLRGFEPLTPRCELLAPRSLGVVGAGRRSVCSLWEAFAADWVAVLLCCIASSLALVRRGPKPRI